MMATRRSRWIGACAIAFALAAAALPAAAQVTTASIGGTVHDTSGGVLPGVTVTATLVETGFARNVVTGSSGDYLLTNLPPGTYELAAELTGFKRFVRSGLVLSIGQDVVIAVPLELGEMSENVVVSGSVALVETRSAAMSGLVDGGTVRTLPLNGRSFNQLALLNPGVSSYSLGGQNVQNGTGLKMSISGARPESTYFMLDGTNILDHSNATPGSAAGNNLGVDGIQEFRVFAHNYSAELGVRAGGAVSVVSRSGSNTFHGSGFEFYRNSKMDARNFFDVGADPPPFNRHQYGASLGGPIVRNRTVFFANVEVLRERLGTTLRAVVPNADARRGILPGVAGAVSISPLTKPYLDLYPLPNGRDFGDGTGELITTFAQPTDEKYAMARVDQTLSPNDTLFGRYTYDRAEIVTPAVIPRFITTSESRNQFFTLQETHIFKQNLINEARFAFNRTNLGTDGYSDPAVDQSLRFFPEAYDVGGITFTSGRGSGAAALAAVGNGGNTPRFFAQNTIQISDNISHQVGRHSLRYGVDLQNFRIDGLLNEQTNGQYSFGGMLNFLLAQPSQFLGPAPGSDFTRKYRQWLLGSYIQDDFAIRNNLSLNIGLRHEFVTRPTENDGEIANLVSPLDPKPTAGVSWNSTHAATNFEPRVGFAWDPRNDGKTSIRGGVGVFFSQVIGRNWYTYQLRQTLWSFNVVDAGPPPFPNPFVNGTKAVLQQNDRIDPALQTPTLYQYNVSIQQQLSGSFMVEAAYVGSRGRHLLRNWEANTAIPTILSDGTYFYPAGSRPRNPNFGPIFTLSSDAESWYDSLQTRLVKRLSHGLQFQASYTWGKSLDTASALQRGQSNNSPAFTMIPDRPDLDKGLSSFNVSHTFSASTTYDLPVHADGALGAIANGWQIGGIVRLQSGVPFDAETGFNRSGDGATTVADRPNLKAGASNNPVLGGPDRYFDPTVFELPAAGYYGNVGRNTMIGPGLAVVDFLVSREFSLGGDRRLAFRGELFNVLNHANFGLPSNRLFNAQGQIPGAAGRITTTTTTARQVQLGLKLTF